jgi:rhomboid protease GluP
MAGAGDDTTSIGDQAQVEPTPETSIEKKISDRSRLITGLACTACVLVFVGLLQERDPDSWNTLSKYGYLPAFDIWGGKYWALLSSVFVHRALLHIAFNVYWLWVLGGALEREIGPLRMLAFFTTSAIVSSGVELAVSGSTGKGASGVGYSIFGFMWIARSRIEAFKKAVPKQVVVLFLGWGVLCIVATLLKTMNVGNAAHVSGLLFGAGIATAFVVRKRVALAFAALSCLILLAVVPLFWCPWSAGWASKQGYDAHARHDYVKAINWYQRSIDLGGDPVWALENMALAYISMGENSKFDDALEKLRQRDPKAAEKIQQRVREGNPSR